MREIEYCIGPSSLFVALGKGCYVDPPITYIDWPATRVARGKGHDIHPIRWSVRDCVVYVRVCVCRPVSLACVCVCARVCVWWLPGLLCVVLCRVSGLCVACMVLVWYVPVTYVCVYMYAAQIHGRYVTWSLMNQSSIWRTLGRKQRLLLSVTLCMKMAATVQWYQNQTKCSRNDKKSIRDH